MASKSKKRWWQIGIGGTEMDGVSIANVYGTEYEIKRMLVDFVKSDKSNDPESWQYGTEKLREVESRNNGTSFYAYGCYSDYHVDYQAYPIPDQIVNDTIPKSKEERVIWP